MSYVIERRLGEDTILPQYVSGPGPIGYRRVINSVTDPTLFRTFEDAHHVMRQIRLSALDTAPPVFRVTSRRVGGFVGSWTSIAGRDRDSFPEPVAFIDYVED